MSESTPSRLDTATKLITVLSLGLGLYATLTALPIDAEVKKLQAETTRLDLALKQADANLKALESNRELTFKLYSEVRAVIDKPNGDPREEEAARVLVDSLAEDPLRWKLLRVIAAGAKSDSVKQAAAATSVFYEENAANVPTGKPVQKVDASSPFGTYNVDVFYCERKKETSLPLATAALALKSASDTGRWRVRVLPDSINQQPGYGIWQGEIRYTPPDEKPVADALVSAMAKQGVKLALHETTSPTPGYVSVFICQ